MTAPPAPQGRPPRGAAGRASDPDFSDARDASNASDAPNVDPATTPLAQRLHAAAAGLREERVSLAGLLRAHGPAAHGSLLLMLAVPCMLPIPGTGTLLGVGLLALALAMWRQHDAVALPARVAALEISGHWARRVLAILARVYGVAGRFSRTRLAHALSAPMHRALAVAVAVMAVILIMPIPFGNLLPALAVLLIGLGLVFRDGLVALLGLLGAAATAVVTLGALVLAAQWGSEWLTRWWA